MRSLRLCWNLELKSRARLTVVLFVALVSRAFAQDQITLSGQTELARLVDLCAERLGLSITYDASVLKGTVTVRGGSSLSDSDLWEITCRVLAERGFTTIRFPQSSSTAMSVVKLSDAAPSARIEDALAPVEGRFQPGFVNRTLRIEHQSVKSIVDAAKVLSSKPGGQVADLGGGNLILVSDLRPRVEEILRLVVSLDAPGVQPVIQRVTTRFVSSAQLAPQVLAASAASDLIAATVKKGKVMATPEPEALLIICPPQELEYWIELIDRFDRRQTVVVKQYATAQLPMAEVVRLVEQAAKDTSPRGAGDQWRVVSDELTGTLIITATSPEHERIEELVARLAALPMEARRPMRVFTIRNRGVRDIVDVITRMSDAGLLAAENSSASEGGTSDSVAVSPSGATTVRPTLPEGTTPVQSTPRTATHSSGSGKQPSTSQPTRSRLELTSDEGTNTLIVMADARLLSQVEELVRKLDVRQPQVMIEVLIVSLNDNDTLDLGVELRKIELSGATTISLSSLFGLGTTGTGPPPASVNAGTGFTGVVLSPGDFSVVLRALQTVNRGRVLSLPKVLVNNNQQATLNSVLQQPFVSVNASDTIATTSFGGSENAGTIISIKPQIAEGDHLVLQYSVSLSSFVGDAIDPTVPPPKQSNNLSSLVTIPDGYTVVVGGLEITNESKGVSQIPLLGDIPLVGEAFKNRSITSSRTRFFVFIRSDVMRHTGFEDLKYRSDHAARDAGIDDGWPEVTPRIIR